MLFPHQNRFAPSCHRREFLRMGGGLAVAAYSLCGAGKSSILRGQIAETGVAGASGLQPSGTAKSCILIYLLGGPPHQDMFDLKPNAPAEIRGPFQPISTSLPGVQICEHLPLLAGLANQYTLIRSVSHHNSNHTPMIYYTLTGRETAIPEADNDIRPPQPDDFPHVGSIIARHLQAPSSLPGFVALPELGIRSSISGEFKRVRSPLRGGGAGFLGATYESLAVNGPPDAADSIPALTIPKEITAQRFERRAALLSLLDREPRGSAAFDQLRGQALVLSGAAAGGGVPAFNLEGEPAAARDRYGRHRFGQSLLLARRLTSAGVPMVAIHFNEMTVCDGWDTHSNNFEALRTELLPMLDQSLSALLADLEDRGQLQETLVVCLGEFGRTPKINANAGRDHWGDCSSALLAGGGIAKGLVLGASDKDAAFPAEYPVDPVDIHATVYHCLGISPRQHLYDQQQRPWEICKGNVLVPVLG